MLFGNAHLLMTVEFCCSNSFFQIPYILLMNLFQNRPFQLKNGCCIDLVLTSLFLFSNCRNWEVLPEISCSDPKFIGVTLFQSLTWVSKRLTAMGRIELYDHIEHDSRFELAMKQSQISPEIVKIALETLYRKWSTSLHRFERNV